MTQNVTVLLAEELRDIPRGDSLQNQYRMVYEMARTNALGSKPQIGSSPEAAHAFALHTVRQFDPGFTPRLG